MQPFSMPNEHIHGPIAKEKPRWEEDHKVLSCRRCRCPFNLLVRQHHCRRCGRIFCQDCSRLRCLVPPDELAVPPIGSEHSVKLNPAEPQRVCFFCAEFLLPYQDDLKLSVAKAAQDLEVDSMSAQRYLNTPLNFEMEAEIKKATYTLMNFCEASDLIGKRTTTEDAPDSIHNGAGIQFDQGEEGKSRAELLATAAGIVFMTVAKAGILFTGSIGSGLVLGRRSDGGWSAPSAIMCIGAGWGVQVGTEVSDCILIIRSKEALDAFCSSAQMSLGTAVGATAGNFGRSMSAIVNTQNDKVRLPSADVEGLQSNESIASSVIGTLEEAVSPAAYSYSHSRGLYLGFSVEAGLLISRPDLNKTFYGTAVTAQTLLNGQYPPPRAAAPLYEALSRVTAIAGESISSFSTSLHCSNSSSNSSIDDGSCNDITTSSSLSYTVVGEENPFVIEESENDKEGDGVSEPFVPDLFDLESSSGADEKALKGASHPNIKSPSKKYGDGREAEAQNSFFI